MLSQLSQPTLISINIFIADLWFGYPVAVILGSIFMISFFVIHFWFEIDLKKESNLLVLFGLCCLAFVFNFFVNVLKTIPNNFTNLNKADDQNLSETFCQVDQAQNMGGAFCFLSQYLINLKALVPAGSKLGLVVGPGVGAYSQYFLYQDFQIVKDLDQADYLTVFLPEQAISVSDQGDLLIRSGSGPAVSYGAWESIAMYNHKIFILKRL